MNILHEKYPELEKELFGARMCAIADDIGVSPLHICQGIEPEETDELWIHVKTAYHIGMAYHEINRLGINSANHV